MSAFAMEEIGRVRAALDAIVVDNPRAQEAHERFRYLIAHGKAQGPGAKRGQLLVGPSQSGKSTIISTFADTRNTPARLEAGEVPVLNVTLRANISTKGLAQNILQRLSTYGFYTGAFSGSENELTERVYKSMAEAKVELLVLDEIHHLNNIEKQKSAWSVGEMIKLFLIDGCCPVVLSGIDTAKTPFLENRQLSQRSEPALELHKLDIGRAPDRALFARFLADYLPAVEVASGVGKLITLLNRETITALHTVSEGVLGAACNLIKAAVTNAMLAGRDQLEVDDLARAVEDGFILTRILTGPNPFDCSAPVLRHEHA
jgi:hypothetical protein